MYRIVFGLSLVIGCLGQGIVPTAPDINSPKAVTPPQNEIPGSIAPANGVPGLPQLPNGVPNLPSSPAIPITTDPEVFERPCRPTDITCIRRYFLHNSKCKPAPGRIPDPLVRSLSNVFYPRVNITETDINPEYLGLNNGRIQEFYVNRDTDKVVLGIELRNFVARSNNTFFTYARRGREPITTHGSASVTFSSVYLTVTIPQVENLRLDKSDSFAFSNDLLPGIVLAPSLGESSDPSIPAAFAAFVANVPINVAEFFLTESSFFAATYIQYVICDFGLQLL